MTSKGSDENAGMRRLVLAFAGCTYHIVGNLCRGSIVVFTAHTHLFSFRVCDQAQGYKSKEDGKDQESIYLTQDTIYKTFFMLC